MIEDSGGNHPDLKGDAWFNAFERTKAAYDFQTIFPLESYQRKKASVIAVRHIPFHSIRTMQVKEIPSQMPSKLV